MARELTVVEIIGLAIQSEEDASVFYGRLSKKIQNELVRAKYEALAKEETSHRHMLAGIYRQMTGEGTPPKIPGFPETAERGGVSFEASSMEELLNFAISREHAAKEFYKSLALKMTDVKARRVIEYLADIEHGHEVMLKLELDAFLRDRDWYADNPDIQLVGP